MGIMILIQKAAILFLIAASMVSTLIMAAVFKWRAILPKSKSGKGVFSMVSFSFSSSSTRSYWVMCTIFGCFRSRSSRRCPSLKGVRF